jgi:hypothetical protein
MTIELETTGPGAVDPRAKQHMVPMRDGVSLAIDVYLPEAAAPCAAVLVRLPYDKNGRYCWMPQIARHFTGRGYVLLVQDVRGKFRSGGEVNGMPKPVVGISPVAPGAHARRAERPQRAGISGCARARTAATHRA